MSSAGVLQPADYPPRLREIHASPKQLYIKGRLPETSHWVAIVGSRRATTYGREVAGHIARELARRDIVIVSGLAVGIDTAAHLGALEVGGLTVAVLGGGLENRSTYHSNQQLAERIVEAGGAVVTEYAAGMPPLRQQFPARNRIIAGLSEVTIVAEAALSSGSLITAAMAMEEGKDVMAVPGNINQPGSVGCNNLLKVGAHPLTDVQDVLDILGLAGETIQLRMPENPQWAEVLQAIIGGTQDGDELIKNLSLDQLQLSQALTYLEINGYIRSLGANLWAANSSGGK